MLHELCFLSEHCDTEKPLLSIQPFSWVFGEHVCLGVPPPAGFIPLFVSLGLKMGKIYHKSNYIELDMTNCDASMTSYSNFVADRPKIRPFSVLVRILVRLMILDFDFEFR